MNKVPDSIPENTNRLYRLGKLDILHNSPHRILEYDPSLALNDSDLSYSLPRYVKDTF